jgi:hypothetical protein
MTYVNEWLTCKYNDAPPWIINDAPPLRRPAPPQKSGSTGTYYTTYVHISNITTAPFSMLVFWLALLIMPGLLRPNWIATKLKREVRVLFKVNKDKRYQLDSSFPTFGKVSYMTSHEHVALSNIQSNNLYNVWIFANTEQYFWSVFMSVGRIFMTCSTFIILVFSLPFIFIDALSYLEHCQIAAKLVRPDYMICLTIWGSKSFAVVTTNAWNRYTYSIYF